MQRTRRMKPIRVTGLVIALALGLAACGNTRNERAATGAGIGALAGAGAGALIGPLGLGTGALIGAGVGAGAGYAGGD